MRFEYQINRDDMYNCYKAFFTMKKTKLNIALKWVCTILDLALVVLFFVFIGLKKYDGLLQIGLITFSLCVITFILFYSQGVVRIIANRNYNKVNMVSTSRVVVEINNETYTETLYDGEDIINQSAYSLTEVSKLDEDDTNIYIMFGRRAASIIKKSCSNEETLRNLGILLGKYRDEYVLTHRLIKFNKKLDKDTQTNQTEDTAEQPEDKLEGQISMDELEQDK